MYVCMCFSNVVSSAPSGTGHHPTIDDVFSAALPPPPSVDDEIDLSSLPPPPPLPLPAQEDEITIMNLPPPPPLSERRKTVVERPRVVVESSDEE